MEYYTFLIIIHLIALFAWFAGLFYLPRLFVYHTRAHDVQTYDLFCLMERRLYKIIMVPAFIVTFGSGLGLIIQYGWSWFLHSGWLHAKLTFVALLIGYHHWLGALLKRFAQRRNQHTEKFYRIINEIPTIILIVVIVLVKIKKLY